VKKAAPVKKATATTASGAKAPAKKATAAKPPAKKATATKAPATRASGAKAPAKKATSPFDAKFLATQKEKLLEERATLTEQAETLHAEAEALMRDREQGDVQFDDESGEGDTIAVERDFDLAREAQARKTIEEIDAALERITKGVYGVCEASGKPIPKERLEALPWARERVEYKTQSFR
jgi:RNA polymerase-binding transcription factor DksA